MVRAKKEAQYRDIRDVWARKEKGKRDPFRRQN
jgi:hypothetical protein